MEIQGTQDNYKVKVINQAMEAMLYDNYYITRLKGDNTKAINLNDEVLFLIRSYYEGRNITVEGEIKT